MQSWNLFRDIIKNTLPKLHGSYVSKTGGNRQLFMHIYYEKDCCRQHISSRVEFLKYILSCSGIRQIIVICLSTKVKNDHNNLLANKTSHSRTTTGHDFWRALCSRKWHCSRQLVPLQLTCQLLRAGRDTRFCLETDESWDDRSTPP